MKNISHVRVYCFGRVYIISRLADNELIGVITREKGFRCMLRQGTLNDNEKKDIDTIIKTYNEKICD